MKVIGLTGGTGSGKSMVSKLLRDRRSYIIDCDQIAHEVILKDGPAYDELVAYFGGSILAEDGEIDRKRLGEIVFHEKEKLRFLSDCTHKYVKMVMDAEVVRAKKMPETYDRIVLDVPLMSDMVAAMCDEVWAVYSHEDIRVLRIMERDGITHALAKKRIASQIAWDAYASYAHKIIDNSQDLAHIEEQLDELCKQE